MAQFLIAYNPRHDKGRISGDWELVDADDKFDALNKVLDIPGSPIYTIFDQSKYLYILEIKPEDKIILKT